MFKGYLPIKIKGRQTTMPADFLVNRKGIIQVAHYGKDEGDHLPFDTNAFSLKCNKSTLILHNKLTLAQRSPS